MEELILQFIKLCISSRNLKYVLIAIVSGYLGYKYNESIALRNEVVIINDYENKIRDFKDTIILIKIDLKEAQLERMQRKEVSYEYK